MMIPTISARSLKATLVFDPEEVAGLLGPGGQPRVDIDLQLPVRIGPIELDQQDGMVVVRCPRRFKAAMRGAGARRKRIFSRRWLVEPQRAGPLIRTLLLIHNEGKKLLATWLNNISAGLVVAEVLMLYFDGAFIEMVLFQGTPITPQIALRLIGVVVVLVVAFLCRCGASGILRRLRNPELVIVG
jgi:hypothetical protein